MTTTIRVGCHSATPALLNRTQLGPQGRVLQSPPRG